uniref:Molybdopterin biosynthesis protein n=1 Tax=Dasya naccarioides TaxID=2007180 RepID=A0A1Z1MHN9_9FLOR|nr:Molybdopterin biosynthesis protein [Dasya naccarioides]ARW65261.1 Molybdopterin biosynthesis protein [Dasya naccarioides]
MINDINNINLLKEEYILYAKHLKLTNIGLNGQKRLKKAKILIIGAGGLGCPIMLYLTAAGIGYIGIVDNDLIDKSNLNRQILYKINNVNKEKLVIAKQNLVQINPYCKIVLHKYKITENNASEIIQYYDIIIDATDNFETRHIIDISCYKLHKAHIYGAVQEFDSQICVFNYKNYLRYYYIYPKTANNFNQYNCNNDGILGITTGNAGVLQATEAIKIILGFEHVTYRKLFICNLITLFIKQIKFYKHKIKQKNNYEKPYLKLFIKQKDLNELNKNFFLIDIRELYEFKIKHKKYFINIPLKNFSKSKTIDFIKNYRKNRKIIIYCKTTYRSLIISRILTKYKINHLIIKNE